MKILITENELFYLIERMVNEARSTHNTKRFKEFMTYARKHLNSNVEEKNNKVKFCPIGHSECYISHPEDKALFDIYRFYAKVFNVSKQKIETSFNQNKPIQ
jgi:hypothetical protein